MQTTNKRDRSDAKIIGIGAVVALIVIFLWSWLPNRIAYHGKDAASSLAEAGQVGDKYGSVNALFSGLAFTGLIVTIFLQRRELKQNTEELANQAGALRAARAA